MSESSMQNADLVYFVKSDSTDEIYELRARSQNGRVNFLCTCLGAQSGAACKHRINLIYGVVGNLLSDRSSDVIDLKNLLTGTSLEQSIDTLSNLEKEADALKRRIASQKRTIARQMFGQD